MEETTKTTTGSLASSTSGGDSAPKGESLADIKKAAQTQPPPVDSKPGGTSEKKKRRRGRPKIEEPPLPEGVAAALVQGVTSYVASRSGQKWQATAGECRAIGTCLEQVIAKYAPGANAYGPEIGLALAVAGYVFTRIEIKIPAKAIVPPGKPPEELKTTKTGAKKGYDKSKGMP